MCLILLSASRSDAPCIAADKALTWQRSFVHKVGEAVCQVSDAAHSSQTPGTQCSLAWKSLKAMKTKNIKLLMPRPGITSSSPVQGVWSAVIKQAIASGKQDAGRSHAYSKALVQLVLVTVFGAALCTRGSACAQDVSVVGLVHAITCGVKFFKICVQLDWI